LAHLAACALALDAPLVSEHIAFVRSGSREAGHLLPVPRTREALDVVVANVRIAQEQLPVPLALENIAAVVGWPDDELTEARFLAEVIDRTGALLLLDVANLFASAVNFGVDPLAVLDELPLESIGYVHVAGGVLVDGVWHDTHTHPVTEPILALLRELAARTVLPTVMLERDGDYPAPAELAGELAAIRKSVGRTDDDTPVRMTTPAPVVLPDPVPDPPRGLLPLRQAGLAAALDGRGGAPASFDQDRVAVARAALVRKRSRAVGRRAPAVAESLGALLTGFVRAVRRHRAQTARRRHRRRGRFPGLPTGSWHPARYPPSTPADRAQVGRTRQT
jgi:hypothetical protein